MIGALIRRQTHPKTPSSLRGLCHPFGVQSGEIFRRSGGFLPIPVLRTVPHGYSTVPQGELRGPYRCEVIRDGLVCGATRALTRRLTSIHSRQIALQVVACVLQGLASAVVWVTGLAILMIADTVEEDETRQCVGYLGVAMMFGV